MEEKVVNEVSQNEVVETTEIKEEKDVKKFNPKHQQKRKVCAFCVEGAKSIDYKDVNKLRKYITEKGKILPARQTNLCSKHQREVTTAIKRARYMALLPYTK